MIEYKAFVRNWFPSLVHAGQVNSFFHAYNDFLSSTPAGKRAVLDDKLMLSGVLHAAGLRTPASLLTTLAGKYFSADRGEVSLQEAAKILSGREAFLKPRSGRGGFGAYKVFESGEIYAASGDAFDGGIEELLSGIARGNYVAQELIKQDVRYGQPAPLSINTVRCIVHMKRNNNCEVVGATWRIGNGRLLVDNASSGGMFCGIDPRSGHILGHARNFAKETFETHPISGYRFAGAEVPDIDKIFDAAITAHRLLQSTMTIGWDVAMTPDGPTIIEANGQWDSAIHVPVDDRFAERIWKRFLSERRVVGDPIPNEGGRAKAGDLVTVRLVMKGVFSERSRAWLNNYSVARGVAIKLIGSEDGSVVCEMTGLRRRVEFVILECFISKTLGKVDRIDVVSLQRL